MMHKRIFTKIVLAFGFVAMFISSQSLAVVYAKDSSAPAPITSNQPTYKSPPLLCGQTGSNGQQLTASQCAQQVKNAAGIQWGHIILLAIILLAVIAIIAGFFITKRKKKTI